MECSGGVAGELCHKQVIILIGFDQTTEMVQGAQKLISVGERASITWVIALSHSTCEEWSAPL